ncbi:MAG: GNAT family N-acetyltransferase [Reichenbachiella sp.]|uniref:GNAT family N-acetyltransferase n=1 Tax=Reichenbachiella sp. TaxID=2184521 RepID=UPI003264A7DA
MIIQKLDQSNIEEASLLILEVAEKYNRGDFTEMGYQKFKTSVLFEGMRQNLENEFHYWGAIENDTMVGLLAIKPPTHLYNMFVHVNHHKKGIATLLWQHMVSDLKPTQVTAFSTTYALPLYLKLGFEVSGEQIDNDELICYPIRWTAENK